MSIKIGLRSLALACAAALVATGAVATPAMAQTVSRVPHTVSALGPVEAGEVTIVGPVRVGSPLSVDPGAWTEGATLTYQWLRDGAPIAGATAAAYTPSPTDLDRALVVQVTGAVEGQDPVTAASAETVVAPGVLDVGSPRVTGTATVSQQVTASPGAWTQGTAFAYQWLLDGAAVPGATASTLTLTSAMAGKALSVKVTGSQAGYTSSSRMSTAVTVKAGTLTGATPSIAGTVKVGSRVSAKPGTWTSGTSLAYQWYASGRAIAGATSSSLTIPASAVGKVLTVKVTGSKAGYTTLVRQVSAAAKVAAGTLTGATPSIAGTVKVGSRVSAKAGTWTAGVSRAYQWYASGRAIAGATSSSLTIPASAVGKVLTVKVTGSKAGYTTLVKSSAGKKIAPGTLFGATPSIAGTVKVGSRVSAKPGAWTSGTSLAYQWYANGSAISGARSSSFTIPSSAAGKTLTVKVTGSKAGYAKLTRTSAGKAVPRPAPAPAPRPPVQGWTPGPDLDCGDFSTQREAQAVFDRAWAAGYGDYHRLDADDDRIACESLP